MKKSYIHVGLGNFSLQRLILNLENNRFDPVAFVDINIEESKKKLESIENLPKDLCKKVFTSITEAKKNCDATVCIIYVSSELHADLVIESLSLELNTFCVKAIACDLEEFKKILKQKEKKKDLVLVQGLNNQWNEASLQMQNLIKDKSFFGEFQQGHCIMWGMQNLSGEKQKVDVTKDGIFFHSMGCHQLGQLVATIGLPESVDCISPVTHNPKLGYHNSIRTSGGSCFFDYGDNRSFSYIGNRAGHGNPFGFASRWSGQWLFHGTEGDLVRDRGRITLYKNGNMVKDLFNKDLDDNLIEDEKKQFEIFHENLDGNKNNFNLQRQSLETWVLMEACNIASREKEKVNIKKLTEELGLYKIC